MILGGVVLSGSLAGATVAPAEPVMSDSLLVDPGVTPITNRRESPGIIESNSPEDDDQISRPSASDLTGSDRLQVLEANAIYGNTGTTVSSPIMNYELMKFLEENLVDFVSPLDRQWRSAEEIQFLEENGLVLTTIPVERESNWMFVNDTYRDYLYP